MRQHVPEPGAVASTSDPPIDLSRVARAVSRHALLVVASVVLVVAVVYAISARAPARYQATARISADTPTNATSSDPNAVTASLATSRALVVGAGVLDAAAARLHGTTGEALSKSVSAAVDPDASIVDVTATAGSAARAATVANTVAATFLAQHTREQRQKAQRTKASVQSQLDSVGNGTAATGLASALRAQVANLAVTQAAAGTDLTLAERATAPATPVAPRPLRNALFAGLSALLLAVVAAVARDRSGRRSAEARELAARAGVALLAVVPDGRRATLRQLAERLRGSRRISDRAIVEQAALQAAVRAALPPRGARTVLVCGIAGGEGASRVARGLARSLSWAGLDSVFVDSALRGPTDEALATARETPHRYLVVSAPVADGSAGLPLLAWEADAAILVGRLGRTSPGAVMTAAQVLGSLDVLVLGLALTAAPADAAAIRELGFDPPAAPPGRRVRRAAAARSGNGRANGAEEWAPNGAGALGPDRQTAG